MVDCDLFLQRRIHRVLGDLMVHHGINLMNTWRSVTNVLNEVALTFHLFDVDYCQAMTLPMRALCIVGMIVMNAYMVATFLRGMKESGSVVGVALSTASNFVFSAIYGTVIWGETMNRTWCVGFACVLAGVMILSNVQSTSTSASGVTVKSSSTSVSDRNGDGKVKIRETTIKHNSNVHGTKGRTPSARPMTYTIGSDTPTVTTKLAAISPSDSRTTREKVALLKQSFTPQPLNKPSSSVKQSATKNGGPCIPVTPSPLHDRSSVTSSASLPPTEGTKNVLRKPVNVVKTKEELKSELELQQYYPTGGAPCIPNGSSIKPLESDVQGSTGSLRTSLIDKSFVNECLLCELPLFDVTTGKTLHDGFAAVADLAPLTCFHVFHAKCLKQSSKAYGNACPMCSKPLSMWHTAQQAASFPGFWVLRVEQYLRAVTEVDQPTPAPTMTCLPASALRDYLRADPTLTDDQKMYIQDDPTGMGKGLQATLEWGGYRDYNNVSKGQVGFTQCLRTKGIWKYDSKKDDIWLWEWGPIHPRQRCDQCQLLKRPLPVECEGCRGSAEAAFYCGDTCSKRDWQRHRLTCQKWQEMGPQI
jgi:multidrug transporter EmrE-like cation transporter